MISQTLLLLSLGLGSAFAASIPQGLVKRDCYQSTATIGDGSEPYVICTSYCENSSQQITGAPQNISSHITCDTTTCPAAVSETYTTTQSFTINIGADASAGDDTIKGGASAGASWSWSQSSATSNSYTFTPSNGDAGYIVFRPYYQQSCGDLKYFPYDTADDGTPQGCDSDAYAEDTNACGQTPIIDSNGFAQGDFTFCYDGGPNAGKGC